MHFLVRSGRSCSILIVLFPPPDVKVMGANVSQSQNPAIQLLLVDDSISFRQLFRDMISDCQGIEITAEAGNGIEALDMVLKYRPDVIVMDLEMPLMDGMTALQHLMIHVPTPTIIISGLTEEGTPRAFDSLKNGAVDFVFKGSFVQNDTVITDSERILSKIRHSNSVSVSTMEPPGLVDREKILALSHQNRVGFCEECGTRIQINPHFGQPDCGLACTNCGEAVYPDMGQKYRRVNRLVVLGAGEGTYSNILKIIPHISPAINGSVVIVMYGNSDHIVQFTRYLDAISLIHVTGYKEGITLSSGTCYIASVHDNIAMSSHLSVYTLNSNTDNTATGYAPLDLFMESVSSVMKKKVLAVILSGLENDGSRGLDTIYRNGGTTCMLDPEKCLYKDMAYYIVDQFDIDVIADEKTLSEKIQNIFTDAQRSIVTA